MTFIKKILVTLVFIVILINLTSVFAVNSITLSAIVGNSNHTPVVISVNPDSNPLYIPHSVDDGNTITWNQQSFIIEFRDDERDEITYTITVETDGGATSPISGTIFTSSFDANNIAYINFDYIAPTTAVASKTFTITLNDGPNITTETINVYVY